MRKSPVECLIDLFCILTVRATERLGARYLHRGYPQLGVFAFDHIGARINSFGRYEHDELAALKEFLTVEGLVQGSCLDVGANIGNHSVFFSSMYAEVHAFEPAPRPFSLLQFNAGFSNNIHCHRVGLSDRNGSAALVAPQANVGAGAVRTDESADRGNATDVALVRLDDFAPVRHLDIGLIKIDVEGHELQALSGAGELLARTRPVIVFEQQPEQIDNATSPVIERLRTLGYDEFYEFARSPAIPLRLFNILWRVLTGEKLYFRRISVFTRKFYPMVVALQRRATT